MSGSKESIRERIDIVDKPFSILVTGSGGQLGQELVSGQWQGIRMIGLNRNQLDITIEKECLQALRAWKPAAIVHAAAYTSVDQAETESEIAYLVNVTGTRNMALAAESIGAKFCYISTDYVFDGFGTRPYRENDPTQPSTVYGKTKLEGEREAVAACSRTFVVRTSWLYGAYGANFVKTMLNLAKAGKPLRIVSDQIGSPTYAYDLAKFLINLVQSDHYGVYHAANGGSCSWYNFAQEIFDLCKLDVEVLSCTSEEYLRPARRPAYSVLECTAMQHVGFASFRDWREALADFLKTR